VASTIAEAIGLADGEVWHRQPAAEFGDVDRPRTVPFDARPHRAAIVAVAAVAGAACRFSASYITDIARRNIRLGQVSWSVN
jgi:hypothetical protein